MTDESENASQRPALRHPRGRPPEDEVPTCQIREYSPDDLDACDVLHREVLGIGRRHDIEFMANFAPPVVVERDGRLDSIVVLLGRQRTLRYSCTYPTSRTGKRSSLLATVAN